MVAQPEPGQGLAAQVARIEDLQAATIVRAIGFDDIQAREGRVGGGEDAAACGRFAVAEMTAARHTSTRCPRGTLENWRQEWRQTQDAEKRRQAKCLPGRIILEHETRFASGAVPAMR